MASVQEVVVAMNDAAGIVEKNARLRAALQRIRNALHAHNRPDNPLSNSVRIRLRDIADLALAED